MKCQGKFLDEKQLCGSIEGKVGRVVCVIYGIYQIYTQHKIKQRDFESTMEIVKHQV